MKNPEARCEYIARQENVIPLGNSGTGKTNVALGLVACQRDFTTLVINAHALAHQLMEACDEEQLLKLQAQLQLVGGWILFRSGKKDSPESRARVSH